MEAKLAPVVAALLLAGSGAVVPAFAQLPPTNMGKFIHQPGDNQYSVNTQLERHGSSYIDRTGPGGPVPVSRGGGGSGAFGIAPMNRSTSINPMSLLGSNTPKVDISLEPISADEPIEPPGFPPLPDRLQLPVQTSSTAWGAKGGGGGGTAAAPAGGGGGSGSTFTGVKQHYAHFKPGGFQQGATGGSVAAEGGGSGPVDPDAPVTSAVGGVNPNRQPVNPGGSLGYYRCLPADPIRLTRTETRGDTFNSNPNGAAAPRYSGASSRDLAKLGAAPKLDDSQELTAAPEAPHAAIVNQSVSQDLSLPDDEFVSRYGLQDTAGKRFARSVGRGMSRAAGRAARRATGVVGF